MYNLRESPGRGVPGARVGSTVPGRADLLYLGHGPEERPFFFAATNLFGPRSTVSVELSSRLVSHWVGRSLRLAQQPKLDAFVVASLSHGQWAGSWTSQCAASSHNTAPPDLHSDATQGAFGVKASDDEEAIDVQNDAARDASVVRLIRARRVGRRAVPSPSLPRAPFRGKSRSNQRIVQTEPVIAMAPVARRPMPLSRVLKQSAIQMEKWLFVGFLS